MGAWIEIQLKEEVEQTRWVAPLVGAWIEISSICCEVTGEILSLPSWERGLKSFFEQPILSAIMSLPSWERGLKF